MTDRVHLSHWIEPAKTGSAGPTWKTSTLSTRSAHPSQIMNSREKFESIRARHGRVEECKTVKDEEDEVDIEGEEEDGDDRTEDSSENGEEEDGDDHSEDSSENGEEEDGDDCGEDDVEDESEDDEGDDVDEQGNLRGLIDDDDVRSNSSTSEEDVYVSEKAVKALIKKKFHKLEQRITKLEQEMQMRVTKKQKTFARIPDSSDEGD